MTFVAAAVLLSIGLRAGTADAQVYNPRSTTLPLGPTVSPYINLLRNGNSPTLNYYGFVRPQFQTNAGLQSLQQQVLTARSGQLPVAESTGDVLVTGHVAVFMNYGGFFQSPIGGMHATRYVPTTRTRQTTTAPATPRLPTPGPR
jgi:hypothetical protein